MIWENLRQANAMGSINSGRHTHKPLAEECLSLDLAWLMRLGPLRDGQAGNGEVRWAVDGAQIGSIKFRLDLRSPDSASLILRLAPSSPNVQPRGIFQKIMLTSTAQKFGGRRWWMRCPVTGERARKLYFPIGAKRFASRKAWNLGYRVERLSHFDRPFEKMFRAQRKLGGEQGLAAGLSRPKGMWRRTFARHLDSFAALDAGCAEAIVGLMSNAG